MVVPGEGSFSWSDNAQTQIRKHRYVSRCVWESKLTRLPTWLDQAASEVGDLRACIYLLCVVQTIPSCMYMYILRIGVE